MPRRLIQASFYKRHANWFIVALGIIIVLAGSFAAVLRVYETADQAHNAICALRQERIDGVRDGKKWLAEHPNGIPGITRDDVLRSIHTQQETVRAFRFANC